MWRQKFGGKHATGEIWQENLGQETQWQKKSGGKHSGQRNRAGIAWHEKLCGKFPNMRNCTGIMQHEKSGGKISSRKHMARKIGREIHGWEKSCEKDMTRELGGKLLRQKLRIVLKHFGQFSYHRPKTTLGVNMTGYSVCSYLLICNQSESPFFAGSLETRVKHRSDTHPLQSRQL